MRNPYNAFCIPNCSPVSEVKRAYRALALKHHPDRGGDAEVMKHINENYEYLMKNKDRIDTELSQAMGHIDGFTIIVGGKKFYGAFNESTATASWTKGS